MLPKMKLTSYEHWLGRLNSSLSDDIKSVYLNGKSISVKSYEFKNSSHLINYTIQRLISEEHNDNNTNLGNSFDRFNIENTVYSHGLIMTMEVATPNALLYEQLGW
jgi:hypothetical protein